jgi:hypothetical protein
MADFEKLATEATTIVDITNDLLYRIDMTVRFDFDKVNTKTGKLVGFTMSISDNDVCVENTIIGKDMANCVIITLAEIVYKLASDRGNYEFTIGGILTSLISRKTIQIDDIKKVNALLASDEKYLNAECGRLSINAYSVKFDKSAPIPTLAPAPVLTPTPAPAAKSKSKYLVVKPKPHTNDQDFESKGWTRDGRFLLGKGKGPKKASHCHVAVEGDLDTMLKGDANPNRRKHLAKFGSGQKAKKCNRLFCPFHNDEEEIAQIRKSVEQSDVSDEDFEEVLEYNLWYYSNKKLFGEQVKIGNTQDAIAFILGGSEKAKSLIWDSAPSSN